MHARTYIYIHIYKYKTSLYIYVCVYITYCITSKKKLREIKKDAVNEKICRNIYQRSANVERCKFAFRHRSQHGAVNPVADWLPVGIRRDRDLGDADDVSTPRHHVSRAHRTVHEAADNHAAGFEKQLDVGRDPR